MNIFTAGVIVLALSLGLPAAQVLAAKEGYKVVTAPEVKKMRDMGAVLVNSLSSIEYEIQHIPGSINIPVTEIESSAKMPKDKATPLIFHSVVPEGPYSKLASAKAVEMGYTTVYWFEGGIAEWRKMQYEMIVDQDIINIEVNMLPPGEVSAMLTERNDIFLLDVQPKWTANWQRGGVPFAKMLKQTSASIPLLDLAEKLPKLPKNKDILIIDAFMKQSVIAAKYLKAKGYTVTGVVKGGIARWIDDGLPVIDKPKADGTGKGK